MIDIMLYYVKNGITSISFADKLLGKLLPSEAYEVKYEAENAMEYKQYCTWEQDLHICRDIFDRFNAHDGKKNWPDKDFLRRNRSMSVGDIVVITHQDEGQPRFYMCAMEGWKDVTFEVAEKWLESAGIVQ